MKEIEYFDEFKKNNALTDGYIPKSPKQVLPDKVLNVLMNQYDKQGANFIMSLAELRSSLCLKSDSHREDARIINSIRLLQLPIAIRNFTFKGREIKYITAPLINKFVQYKDNQKYVEISINPEIVTGLIAKAGYTKIDLQISNRFKTKYGLKLYEMYLRYKTLPNNQGNNVGTVSKTIKDLNEFLTTNYKTPSEIKRGIDRGLREIQKITGELITCYYDKIRKVFVFSWKQSNDYLKDLTSFKAYIRKNKVNEDLYEDEKLCLSVSPAGRLYNKYTAQEFNKDDAIVIWQKLYERELRKQQEDSVELS